MTVYQAIALISRWIHVLSFVTAVGGAIFMRFVLMPAVAATLPAEAQAKLRESLVRRWQMVVHPCIALLLLSGGYNFYVAAFVDHVKPMPYHALFGIKVVLALLVFFLAIGLTSRKNWSANLRRDSRKWLGYLVGLAVVVILLSGVLKQLHVPRVAGGGSAVNGSVSR
ncbi:MAG TPA: hypothetical protein VGM03_10580 [Phycisphaerae bacterium]|jgi:uncharacterized membrane protein